MAGDLKTAATMIATIPHFNWKEKGLMAVQERIRKPIWKSRYWMSQLRKSPVWVDSVKKRFENGEYFGAPISQGRGELYVTKPYFLCDLKMLLQLSTPVSLLLFPSPFVNWKITMITAFRLYPFKLEMLKCHLRPEERATLGSRPTILEHLRGRTCIFGQQPLEPGTALQTAAETILINKFGQLRKIMLSCVAMNVICLFH